MQCKKDRREIAIVFDNTKKTMPCITKAYRLCE